MKLHAANRPHETKPGQQNKHKKCNKVVQEKFLESNLQNAVTVKHTNPSVNGGQDFDCGPDRVKANHLLESDLRKEGG